MKIRLSIWFQGVFNWISILYFFFTNHSLFQSETLIIICPLMLGLSLLLLFSEAGKWRKIFWVVDKCLIVSGLLLFVGFVCLGPFFFLIFVGAPVFVFPVIGYALVNIFLPIFRGMGKFAEKRAEKIMNKQTDTTLK